MIYAIYIASVIGALGVYFMLPHRWSLARFGGVVGASGLGLMMFWLLPHAEGVVGPSVFYYIFTAIGLAAASRVITHPRPVYSALYFVLVVLSTAGILVQLSAEFMAFAMVIIYGGAILVTYMFVIMLATMPQSAEAPDTSPLYDRQAREPLAAVVVGFVLLAVLTSVIFNPVGGGAAIKLNYPDRPLDALRVEGRRVDVTNTAQRQRLQLILREQGKISPAEQVYGVDIDHRRIDVREAVGSKGRTVTLDDAVLNELVPNIDQIGQNLFERHTLGIELAAVILLLSMVGAIVIARRHVPEQVTTGFELPPSPAAGTAAPSVAPR